MAHVEGEIVIKRPVEEVFNVVVDERNEPRYNPNMLHVEKLTDGPVGKGTRFSAGTTTRGRPTEMTIEITGCDPPWRYTQSTHLADMDIDGTVTFEPISDGTRMRWSWQVHPRGLYKLIDPLIAGMGRRQEEKIWAGLKEFLEAKPASSEA